MFLPGKPKNYKVELQVREQIGSSHALLSQDNRYLSCPILNARINPKDETQNTKILKM